MLELSSMLELSGRIASFSSSPRCFKSVIEKVVFLESPVLPSCSALIPMLVKGAIPPAETGVSSRLFAPVLPPPVVVVTSQHRDRDTAKQHNNKVRNR